METGDLIKKTLPFLEKDLITELSGVSKLRSFDAGSHIVDEGEYIKAFPIVIAGTIRVVRLTEDGNELLLYFLKQGEICAMALTCCLGLKKSNIRMIAEEKSAILSVPVDKPEKWMSEYRSWKEFMMYSIRKRFDELLDTIDSIAFMRLDERLIRFFRERYRSTGKMVFSGTHHDLALQLNTSREVISRLLRKLENDKLVITDRNTIDYSAIATKLNPL